MSKIITKGYVAIECRMNPHRVDDNVMYKKFLAFLPDEDAVKEFEKKHHCTEIVEIGKYSPSIDLD